MNRTSVAASAIRSTLVILTLGLALAVAPRSVVRAESTITVTTDADTVAADGLCSLREAIQAADTDLPVNECIAGSGTDRIVFSADGTIILSSILYVNSAMTIDGAGLAVALSGNDAVGVLNVLSGGDLTLKQLTVQDGWGGSGQGAGIYNGGTLTVLSSTIAQNATDSNGSGGGLYNRGTATVIDSTFSDNSAGFGGAIYNVSGGNLTIRNSAIVNNHGTNVTGSGPGIVVNSTVTVTNTTFSGNTSVNLNFGAVIGNFGTLTLTHNTFLGNLAHVSSVSISTTYLAGNLLGATSGNSACSGSGTKVDNGYNLSADASCGFTALRQRS